MNSTLQQLLDAHGTPPATVCLDWAWQLEQLREIQFGGPQIGETKRAFDDAADLSWRDFEVSDDGKLSLTTNRRDPRETKVATSRQLESLLEQLLAWAKDQSPKLVAIKADNAKESNAASREQLAAVTLSLLREGNRETRGDRSAASNVHNPKANAASHALPIKANNGGGLQSKTQQSEPEGAGTREPAGKILSRAVLAIPLLIGVLGIAWLLLPAGWNSVTSISRQKPGVTGQGVVSGGTVSGGETPGDSDSSVTVGSSPAADKNELGEIAERTSDDASSQDKSEVLRLGTQEISDPVLSPGQFDFDGISGLNPSSLVSNGELPAQFPSQENSKGDTAEHTPSSSSSSSGDPVAENFSEGHIDSAGVYEPGNAAKHASAAAKIDAKNVNGNLLADSKLAGALDTPPTDVLNELDAMQKDLQKGPLESELKFGENGSNGVDTPPMLLTTSPGMQVTKTFLPGGRRIREPVWHMRLESSKGFTVTPSTPQILQGKSIVQWQIVDKDAVQPATTIVVRAQLANPRSTNVKWRIVAQAADVPQVMLPLDESILSVLEQNFETLPQRIEWEIERLRGLSRTSGLPAELRSNLSKARGLAEQQQKLAIRLREIIASVKQINGWLDGQFAVHAD